MSEIKAEWTLLDDKTPSGHSQKLSEFLQKNVRGQDDAIKDLSELIEVREAGFQEPHRPICVELFVGPSGVGKTLVAEMLAEFFFGNRKSYTRIACETYSERHGVSRLIGSPPGYVGFFDPDRGSGSAPILSQANIDKWAVTQSKELAELTEQIKEAESALEGINDIREHKLLKKYFGEVDKRTAKEAEDLEEAIRELTAHRYRLLGFIDSLKTKLKAASATAERPLSIILFDEVEKAAAELHNMILNILDQASLTMSNGNITDFTNSLIIMTSNVASREIAKVVSGRTKIVGYQPLEDNKRDKKKDPIWNEAMEALKNAFAPEFLARFDRISVFRPLSAPALSDIFDLELARFDNQCLKPLLISLDMDIEVKKFIVAEATDRPENGARLLKRKIFKHLKRQVARMKNRGEITIGDTLHVVMEPATGTGGKPAVRFYKTSPPIIAVSPIAPPGGSQ